MGRFTFLNCQHPSDCEATAWCRTARSTHRPASTRMLFGFGRKPGNVPSSPVDEEQTQTLDRQRQQQLGAWLRTKQSTRDATTTALRFDVGSFLKAGQGKSSAQNQDASFVKKGSNSSPTIVAVLDGHGSQGAYVSKAVANNLLSRLQQVRAEISEAEWEELFSAVDADLEQRIRADEGGATASVALVSRDGSLRGAWVGDSRVIVGGLQGSQVWAKALSISHTTENPTEVRRIIKAGGVLQDTDTGRMRAASTGSQRIGSTRGAEAKRGDTRTLFRFKVDSGVACTRAFGDFDQRPFCISTPETFYARLAPQQALVLATDGVWDVLTNEEVMSVLAAVRERGGDANSAAKEVALAARGRWVQYSPAYIDDVTVVVVVAVG